MRNTDEVKTESTTLIFLAQIMRYPGKHMKFFWQSLSTEEQLRNYRARPVQNHFGQIDKRKTSSTQKFKFLAKYANEQTDTFAEEIFRDNFPLSFI